MSSTSSFRRLAHPLLDILGKLGRRRVEARAPAHAVDRLEAAGRNEPGARIVGHAVARPLLSRCDEGVVQRLLRPLEIAQKPDELARTRRDSAR